MVRSEREEFKDVAADVLRRVFREMTNAFALIVELHVQARHAKSYRGILAAEEQNEYVYLGMYAYGNQYGITGRTQSLPHTVKYLNNFL